MLMMILQTNDQEQQQHVNNILTQTKNKRKRRKERKSFSTISRQININKSNNRNYHYDHKINDSELNNITVNKSNIQRQHPKNANTNNNKKKNSSKVSKSNNRSSRYFFTTSILTTTTRFQKYLSTIIFVVLLFTIEWTQCQKLRHQHDQFRVIFRNLVETKQQQHKQYFINNKNNHSFSYNDHLIANNNSEPFSINHHDRDHYDDNDDQLKTKTKYTSKHSNNSSDHDSLNDKIPSLKKKRRHGIQRSPQNTISIFEGMQLYPPNNIYYYGNNKHDNDDHLYHKKIGAIYDVKLNRNRIDSDNNNDVGLDRNNMKFYSSGDNTNHAGDDNTEQYDYDSIDNYARKNDDHEEDLVLQPSSFQTTEDNQKLIRLVMDGLGLNQLPNMAKMNISQQEYLNKYREYLRRAYGHKKHKISIVEIPRFTQKTAYPSEDHDNRDYDNGIVASVPLHILSIPMSTKKHRQKREMPTEKDEDGDKAPFNRATLFSSQSRRYESESSVLSRSANNNNINNNNNDNNNDNNDSNKNNNNNHKKKETAILLHFSLTSVTHQEQMHADDIEEANIRLMLIHSPALAFKNQKQQRRNHHQQQHTLCRNRITLGTMSQQQHTRNSTKRRRKHALNLKVYQLFVTDGNGSKRRRWLDSRKIMLEWNPQNLDETHRQWLQFDVTKAVVAWLMEQQQNDANASILALEIQCDNCQRIGARILNDDSDNGDDMIMKQDHKQRERKKGESQNFDKLQHHTTVETTEDNGNRDAYQLMPVLNIIVRIAGVASSSTHYQKHQDLSASTINSSRHNHIDYHNSMKLQRPPLLKTSEVTCNKEKRRCCRHAMEVIFKEIKGFEFIIQPKVFDAGYCYGRCPPRYNPAHHHAMLQSLIWKQNRTRAPRPCCAPSKLVELEVLHVDENDSEKLKISTWSDMRVVECACS